MNKIFDFIWSNKLNFIGIFFLVFTVSYLFLVAIDFLPESPAEAENEADKIVSEIKYYDDSNVGGTELDDNSFASNETELDIIEESAEDALSSGKMALPLMINIPKLDKNIKILNPNSRNIVDLDNALLDGVVRHPDSAALNQEGNVFILGHSSYLPRVFNKNFQAFNGIQDLVWGDKIEIFSDNQLFEYRVDKVYKAGAQDTTVPTAGAGHKLTLATCNSFGSVDDRWIVEAKRVAISSI
jgi:LPXTG-site transpeptidase (sortase) family protein